ncbi:MAG: hypothetical protein ABI759_16745 [Candidatus Solibacter sp.]
MASLVLLWAPAPLSAQAPAQAPAQTPAPQQPAPPQPPPQEEPPAEETPQPADQVRRLKLPPAPPKVTDVRMPGEAGWYIGITGWLPYSSMVAEKGEQTNFVNPSHLELPGRARGAFGAEFGVAAGLHNSLKFSYWQAKKSGEQIAQNDLTIFSQGYAKGDLLSTSAKLSDLKISYEFLTWPYPVEARHFRLKTLFQLHYINMKTVVDAPILSSTQDPSTGALISYSTFSNQSILTPSFGLGVHQYASRHVHFEANVAGFGWPGHWYVGDADASVAYRTGKVELQVGVKGFIFRTSPKSDYYFRGSLGGVFAAVRWHSD